jgi:transposase
MRRTRRTYTREFKIEAVRLFQQGDRRVSELARELEIDRKQLKRWADQFEQEQEEAFPGKGHLKPQDEELRRLKRENERLREEREILKKALAIFSGPRPL